jgi:hypothetical protein
MNLSQPIIQFVSQSEAALAQPWEIATDAGLLRILPGFRTDGASIPGVLDGLPGYHHFEGDTFPAAFAHDALYASQLCDRHTADEVLFDLMVANGVSDARAGAYFNAVRVFGGRVWQGKSAASIANARKFVTLSALVTP